MRKSVTEVGKIMIPVIYDPLQIIGKVREDRGLRSTDNFEEKIFNRENIMIILILRSRFRPVLMVFLVIFEIRKRSRSFRSQI